MGSSTFPLFFSFLLLSLAMVALSQPPAADVFLVHKCKETSGNYTANSAYEANLNAIISGFSTIREFNYGFFNLSAGESPDQVHSIALCRGDMNQADCNACLNYTATELKRGCPFNKAATAWSEKCLVRYANRDLYGRLENDPRTCAYNTMDVSNPDQFNRALSDLLLNLSNEAAAGGPLRKYASGNASSASGNPERVYATAQCTPDMDQQNCTTCLQYAREELQKCCSGKIGCRILRPTCVLRFESNLFYNQTAVPLPSPLPSSSPSPTPTPNPIPNRGNGSKATRGVMIVIALLICWIEIWIC